MSQSEDHSVGFENYVKRNTALDMLTTEELVQELSARDRVKVITAWRNVDLHLHGRDGLMESMQQKLAVDVGGFLYRHGLIAYDEEHMIRTRQMKYSAIVMAVAPYPQEADA